MSSKEDADSTGWLKDINPKIIILQPKAAETMANQACVVLSLKLGIRMTLASAEGAKCLRAPFRFGINAQL
jgi:hypothetical protein